jgi:hypothetical protein
MNMNIDSMTDGHRARYGYRSDVKAATRDSEHVPPRYALRRRLGSATATPVAEAAREFANERNAGIESGEPPTITAQVYERAFGLGRSVRYVEEALDPSRLVEAGRRCSNAIDRRPLRVHRLPHGGR